ncbi:hypothetical protein HYQ46_011481 [Verticillium longisporum]|nr:hypothetical protein HYQ46_011481 [Verticillium longisporum]
MFRVSVEVAVIGNVVLRVVNIFDTNVLPRHCCLLAHRLLNLLQAHDLPYQVQWRTNDNLQAPEVLEVQGLDD